MSEDRVALARKWISEYTTNPHPNLGRDGVVCPFMVQALRRDYLTIRSFNAVEGDHSLIVLARGLRDAMIARSSELGAARIYLVSMIVPYGLPDHELKAMVARVHAVVKPEFVQLGLMAGDFWPNHETVGLRSDSFRPFASPIPMLGMRWIVPADLMFFVKQEPTPRDRLTQLRYFHKIFAGRLNEYWSRELDLALAAVERELAAAAEVRG
jgi:hypothetical protein